MADSANTDPRPEAAAPAADAAGPNGAGIGGAGIGGIAQAIGVRNLWIIILTMPAVFLVIVAAIIAIFGRPGSRDESPSVAAPAAPAAETVAGEAILLPEGAAPGAIALDGDRLAVRLDGPGGTVVVVYDLAKGEVIARVPFAPDD